MLISVEQAFVGRDERSAPLKTPPWEVSLSLEVVFFVLSVYVPFLMK